MTIHDSEPSDTAGYARASLEAGSPSMSDFTDSPGSVASSFRRGDLADIEDLDLEPELETVSECDEESSSLGESSSFCEEIGDQLSSLNIGDLDSDSEHHDLVYGLGLEERDRRITSASDYARRKRSEWLLTNYANKIAARRPRKTRKGRISEIAEEGGEIQTTVMPTPNCDVCGPPAPAPRSTSPSDSVPAIPSPLCSMIEPEDRDTSVERRDPSTDGMETSVETLRGETTKAITRMTRRSSSPLRPCFRRRGSQSGSSTRESSVERGRSVRFSKSPPQEVRTHSPVEYDRKSCVVNNRLSAADVEELRTMRMEMGLLEARWAAVAACKPRKVEGTEGTVKPSTDKKHIATPTTCGAESDSVLSCGAYASPAARLRQHKDRSDGSEAMSVWSKFGHTPPPPLPGMNLSRARSSSSLNAIPTVIQTRPSPPSTPHSPGFAMSLPKPTQGLMAAHSTPCARSSGYDSPASEFYESGSEYDLIG